jgi:hypothetical protein
LLYVTSAAAKKILALQMREHMEQLRLELDLNRSTASQSPPPPSPQPQSRAQKSQSRGSRAGDEDERQALQGTGELSAASNQSTASSMDAADRQKFGLLEVKRPFVLVVLSGIADIIHIVSFCFCL